MNKSNKLFKLFLIISSVVIVLGIVLYAVLGFNTLPEHPTSYTFEVHYDVMIELGDKEDDLAKFCEDAFAKYGIKYTDKDFVSYVDSSALTESTDSMLVYTFAKGTDTDALSKAAADVNAKTRNDTFNDAELYASFHALESERIYDYAWRGAIALAVGMIVAFAYVCLRYGVSCAVAGLACAAHDALLTAALFAVTRFPVYTGAVLLYAAVAAFASLVIWLVYANKVRAAFKSAESASTTSEEIIRATSVSAKKSMLLTAALIAGIIVVLGLIGALGTMLYVLPAIVGAAVPLYSTLFIGPEVYVPIKAAFEKRKAAKKGGYVGKKKAAATEAE